MEHSGMCVVVGGADGDLHQLFQGGEQSSPSLHQEPQPQAPEGGERWPVHSAGKSG
jgi:hypothetical protein